MARVVVSEASGLAIDGEIISWDWGQKSGVVLVAGQHYRVFEASDGDAYVVMSERDARRFQHTANMVSVVFRCSFCLGKLDDREQVFCSACCAFFGGSGKP